MKGRWGWGTSSRERAFTCLRVGASQPVAVKVPGGTGVPTVRRSLPLPAAAHVFPPHAVLSPENEKGAKENEKGAETTRQVQCPAA